jgi:hypothetical protein
MLTTCTLPVIGTVSPDDAQGLGGKMRGLPVRGKNRLVVTAPPASTEATSKAIVAHSAAAKVMAREMPPILASRCSICVSKGHLNGCVAVVRNRGCRLANIFTLQVVLSEIEIPDDFDKGFFECAASISTSFGPLLKWSHKAIFRPPVAS